MTASMLDLLTLMVDRRASDLHLNPGAYPALRIHGEIVALTEYDVMTAEDTQRLIYSVLTEAQKKRFEEESELDVSFGVKGLARFRANVYMQRGAVTAALRLVPSRIPSIQELGLPSVVEHLTRRRKGLVLVCGPNGAGKSTTLAAMIDKINTERAGHIVILEDPIEFLHQHKKCVVSQREIGADTKSFQRALRSALRQDPDVVMLGEMRDLETIQTALTIAETGHLTLATLHTNSCAESIHRLIDVFPPHQQNQVRAQLAQVLEGVLCQNLIPRADGPGLVMAMEIMIMTPAVRTVVRDGNIHLLYSTMQLGTRDGMQTLNQALAQLVQKGLITLDEAMNRTPALAELRQLLSTSDTAPAKTHAGEILRLLVVDDEPEILSLMVDVLQGKGYSLHSTSDSLEAARLLETTPFDVIVSDIMMPHLSGVSLLEFAQQRNPNVQVVFVTGQATGDLALAALEKGAAYVEKPFEPRRLLAAVSEAIALSQLKKSAGS